MDIKISDTKIFTHAYKVYLINKLSINNCTNMLYASVFAQRSTDNTCKSMHIGTNFHVGQIALSCTCR